MVDRTYAAARTPLEGDSAADRSAEAIRQEIAAKRDHISQTVDKIGDRIEGTLDWHTYVSRHPFAALGVAALGGLLVSRLFVRRPSPGERILDALAETAEGIGGSLRHRIGDALASRAIAGRAVKAAATAAISRLTVEFVIDRLASASWPGGNSNGVRYGKRN